MYTLGLLCPFGEYIRHFSTEFRPAKTQLKMYISVPQVIHEIVYTQNVDHAITTVQIGH